GRALARPDAEREAVNLFAVPAANTYIASRGSRTPRNPPARTPAMDNAQVSRPTAPAARPDRGQVPLSKRDLRRADGRRMGASSPPVPAARAGVGAADPGRAPAPGARMVAEPARVHLRDLRQAAARLGRRLPHRRAARAWPELPRAADRAVRKG